jgi:hypothetical protein
MATSNKGFYDYVASDLSTTLPKDVYHLKIKDASVGEWDDGRSKLDVTTEVVSGAFAGKYGPRHTWSPRDEDFVGETADGREFVIEADKEKAKFVVQVQAIADGMDVVITNPNSFDEAMLREIAQQIRGREFIANVTIDKNGYPRMGRLYPMSAPPKGFKAVEMAGSFSIDNI